MPEHPGHQVRPANSVVMLLKRLGDVENAKAVDAMELVGIWDELARVDRKWREQTAGGSERRRDGDETKMAGWFARLIRQIERFLRQPEVPAAERAALEQTLAKCRAREPIAPAERG
jgi:hypothetical protein